MITIKEATKRSKLFNDNGINERFNSAVNTANQTEKAISTNLKILA